MILATINKRRRLLCLGFVQNIQVADMDASEADITALLDELTPGFVLLADFERLGFMAPECATPIGRMMELFEKRGVSKVVRILPAPQKDIGLNILTHFHYRRRPIVATCENIAQAVAHLE